MTLRRLSSSLSEDKYADFLIKTNSIKWVAPLIVIVIPFGSEFNPINVVWIGDTIP